MRSRALSLATCASLFFLHQMSFLVTPALASGPTDAVPVEDVIDDVDVVDVADYADATDVDDSSYDYGDADDDYDGPSAYYVALRGSVRAADDETFQTGTTTFATDLDPGFAFSAAFGVDMEQAYDMTLLRGEVEVGNFYHSSASGDARGSVGFVSFYRDLGEFYRFRPYVGLGIGVAHVSLDYDTPGGVAIAGDAAGAAFHFTTGLSMDFSDSTALEIGYRVMSVHDIAWTGSDGSTGETSLNSHAVFAGLRLKL